MLLPPHGFARCAKGGACILPSRMLAGQYFMSRPLRGWGCPACPERMGFWNTDRRGHLSDKRAGSLQTGPRWWQCLSSGLELGKRCCRGWWPALASQRAVTSMGQAGATVPCRFKTAVLGRLGQDWPCSPDPGI